MNYIHWYDWNDAPHTESISSFIEVYGSHKKRDLLSMMAVVVEKLTQDGKFTATELVDLVELADVDRDNVALTAHELDDPRLQNPNPEPLTPAPPSAPKPAPPDTDWFERAGP